MRAALHWCLNPSVLDIYRAKHKEWWYKSRAIEVEREKFDEYYHSLHAFLVTHGFASIMADIIF